MFKKIALPLLLAFSFSSHANALSSSTCHITPSDNTMRQASTMAHKTQSYLDSSGASVALIARMGSDISSQGHRYTHIGAAVKTAKGWTITHLLNQCHSSRSGILREAVINFFLDNLFSYDTLVIIPTNPMQTNLALLLNGSEGKVLHNPNFSMIANPLSPRYQNSNQWILEVVAKAQAAGVVQNRSDAQKFLANHSYQPDVISLNGLKHLEATSTKINLRYDDHSTQERSSGTYQLVLIASIQNYMQTNNLIKTSTVLTP